MDNIISKIDNLFPEFRSTERWNCHVHSYPSVGDFCSQENYGYGIHTIFNEVYPIDLHLDLKKELPLIICLNGALSSRDFDLKIPVFSGFGVLPSSKASIVRISDPVLYSSKSIKHAWYAGAAGMRLHDDIFQIINKIIDIYTPKSVIFFGGSSGGFACLSLSKMFEASIAIVWNPQTDILKFAKEPVLEYTNNAFGISEFENCERILPLLINSNVYCDYKIGVNNNYVLYMQNVNDWHVRWHCKPFLRATNRELDDSFSSRFLGDDFYLYVGDWGQGHAPPSRDFQARLINSILDSDQPPSILFSGDILPSLLIAADSHR